MERVKINVQIKNKVGMKGVVQLTDVLLWYE
jgi:hypothetical protein